MTKAYLIPEEIEQLEAAAECLRDRLLIRLLFRLGCRVSEALGLTVDDVDFAQGTVTITHLKVRTNLSCPDCRSRLSRVAKFCPGCGKRVEGVIAGQKEHRRVRSLPVDDDILDMVKEYIDRGGPVSQNGKRLLFGINRHRAWQIIRDCAHRAGLGDLINPETGKVHHVSPHKLRDAFAVHAVKQDDSGDGLRLLQEHLGHTSFNTTARYRKIAGEEHRKWYRKIMGGTDGGSN